MRDVLETHLPHVYRFALQLAGDPDAAQDIAQETMLRAWRWRKRLREPRAAKRWLLTVAANIWRDQLRRRRSRPTGPMPLPAELPADEPRAGEALTQREAIDRVRRQIRLLPPRQRQVLYLRAFEELGLEEIADILSISVNAAKTSLSLARRTLREKLSEYDPARETSE